MIGIYKITSPTNKIYIGQSINIHQRWKSYHSLNCKQQKILYVSLKKYGVDKHKFEIQEQCIRESLNDNELKWYNHYEKDTIMLNSVIPNTLYEVEYKHGHEFDDYWYEQCDIIMKRIERLELERKLIDKINGTYRS